MFACLINLFWQPHLVETFEEALKIAQYEVQKNSPVITACVILIYGMIKKQVYGILDI